MKRAIILYCSLLLSLTVPELAVAQKVDLHSLLTEMMNRETLARFPSPEYSVAQFSSYDPDYGKFRIRLNGIPSTVVIDEFSDAVANKRLNLGTMPVKKGDNLLEIETLEARNNEKKTAFFGLDYLLFTK